MDGFLNSSFAAEVFNGTSNETFDDVVEFTVHKVYKEVVPEVIPYTVLFIFAGLVVGGTYSLLINF